MKHLFSAALIVFALNFSFAQEAFVSFGRNFTTYNFTNSMGEENPNISPSSGNAYEIGVGITLENWLDGLSYVPSLALNQYNATGGNFVNNYSWNTNFMGLNNALQYKPLDEGSKFQVGVKVGVGLSMIIQGEQKINGATFDLTGNDEFKGLWTSPVGGLDVTYYFFEDIGLGLGYTYSKVIGGGADDQELDFTNGQLQFSLKFNLN